MQVIYHPHAESELIDAAQFYEQQVAGLGAEFLQEFDAAVAVVVAKPERWAIVEQDIRRYSLARFPYSIYFRFLEVELRIVAVKHHRRDPDYWRYRVKP